MTVLERFKRLRAELEARLSALSARERVMVLSAGAAVLAFAGFLVVHGVQGALRAREGRIAQKTRVLHQIGELAEGYRRFQAERAALEARLRGPPVQLMSLVAKTGAALGVEVTDLRPTGAPSEAEGVVEESVEVSLARIDLGTLAQLLQGLERGAGLVKVRRLRIATRSDDPKLVDATVVVAAYQLKG